MGKVGLDIKTMNKALIKKRFADSKTTYNKHAVAQQQISMHLAQLIKAQPQSHFDSVLEVGCGTGGYTRILLSTITSNRYVLNDLCNHIHLEAIENSPKTFEFIEGDAETVDLGNEYDLITSASTVQWFVHPDAFVGKCHAMLKSDGLLLINTFGPENLIEIKQTTGSSLTYYTTDAIKQWFEPYFEHVQVVEEKIQLHFDTPRDVLKHIKLTGVNALSSSSQRWSKQHLENFTTTYSNLFATDQGVALTYHPIYIVASGKKIKDLIR